LTGAASIKSDHENSEMKPVGPARAREGAQWFFWIVGLATLDSVFTILGSHLHHFTGLGVTAMLDGLVHHSGGSGAMRVIVNGWVAGAFLLLGYCAAEGKQWAFLVGMAAYTVDGAMCVAIGDYPSAVFHALMVAAIYLRFAAMRKSSSTKPSDAALAARAGG
jgi:hypothetical protein